MAGRSLHDAYGIGRRYEERLDDSARRRGAHFTPPDVAETLVGLALARWAGDHHPVVCDPSCGGGVFLVAAAEALVVRGADPSTVVRRLVVGIDVDPGAAAASTAALRRWAEGYGVIAEPRVIAADALDVATSTRAGPTDIVVGNPPFQNQLGGATARSAADRAALSARFGAAAGGYVDLAALFQLVGLDLVDPGGVVALIQPRSFLVARDAAAVRDRLLRDAALHAVWMPGEQLFAAAVDVCATLLVVAPEQEQPVASGSTAPSTVAVLGGRDGSTRHGVVLRSDLEGAPTWSPVWAAANGVPSVRSPAPGSAAPGATASIGSIATATAGFRDQYYGLLDHVYDDEPVRGAPLVTTAMIEPGRCDWFERSVTIGKQRRIRPWIDLDQLASANAAVSGWVERLLIPKVLVATQTKVIEAVADPFGTAVPLTPVIVVVPIADADPSHLEAALLAPAATAWALRRFGGAGMSAGALKLAAKQVLEIPLPVHVGPWDAAVALLAADGGRHEATWRAFGRQMNAAWGLDDDPLVEWWLQRFARKIDRRAPRSIH